MKSAMLKRHRLVAEQVFRSFRIFTVIPLTEEKVNIAEALEIASQYNIYASDAYYLELAKRLKRPLLTLDEQMKKCAMELNIELLKV